MENVENNSLFHSSYRASYVRLECIMCLEGENGDVIHTRQTLLACVAVNGAEISLQKSRQLIRVQRKVCYYDRYNGMYRV